MNDVLHDHIAVGYCVYNCDDLFICTQSDDPAKCLLKLTTVLDTLWEHELLIKGSKAKLFRTHVEFFAFNFLVQDWSPLESKVAAVVEWHAKETVKHMRSLLGMVNFFHTFIKSSSEMVAPPTDLLKVSDPGTRRIACRHGF